MATATARSTSAPRWMHWAGWLLSVPPVLTMSIGAAFRLSRNPEAVSGFMSKYGFPESAIAGIGVLEVATVALYLVPQTSVLGAIVMAGYLGGAVATNVRIGDPLGAAIPAVLGILAWGGLYLRDRRIRALIPFRRPA